MENNDILEDQWDNQPETIRERRGVFLLVLCILSWAFIGITIISTLITYAGGTAQLEESMEVSEAAFDQETGSEFLDSMMGGAQDIMVKTIENFNAIQLSTLVALLIGGLAVYMMFMLKKTGYYLYILYTIAIPSISLYFLGASTIIVLSLAFSAFVGIAFIIMYGVNLKRMTD